MVSDVQIIQITSMKYETNPIFNKKVCVICLLLNDCQKQKVMWNIEKIFLQTQAILSGRKLTNGACKILLSAKINYVVVRNLLNAKINRKVLL